MSIAVKIRGIYATALTRLSLDQGVTVVSPSDPIIRRFGKAKGLVLVGVHDVEITDLDDKEGIRIEGESEGVSELTRALRDRFFDAICRNKTTSSAELEFPFAAKTALDELRNRVLPTVPRHHHLRIIASDEVNLLEEERLTGHPEKREALGLSMEKSLVWERFQKGKEIQLQHVKLDGRVIFLSEGEIVEEDFWQKKLVLRRFRFKGRSKYDGLGIDKREGDYAISEIQEGLWYYRHTYFRSDGTLIGRYVNINTPAEFYPDRIRYVDLEIDVVQMADGRVIVTDEEDLEKQFEAGTLGKELKERARAEASQRLERLREL